MICALTGPSTIPHLEENLGGSGWRIPAEDLSSLEAFFQQEEDCLRQEQKRSIRQILTGPLSQETSIGFTDLVYVMETALELHLAREDQVIPMFRVLLALRQEMDAASRRKMEHIQKKLKEMIIAA